MFVYGIFLAIIGFLMFAEPAASFVLFVRRSTDAPLLSLGERELNCAFVDWMASMDFRRRYEMQRNAAFGLATMPVGMCLAILGPA